MVTAHYVAKKTDDHYELVRTSAEGGVHDAGWMIAGGLLAACGVIRRGLSGGTVAVVGGGLFYYGLTGRNPLGELVRCRRPIEGEPSFQHDVRPTGQRPVDAVDEASMESFPASDVPATMSGSLPR